VPTIVRRIRRYGETTVKPEFRFLPASFDWFMATRRFGALDGLRAVSAIAVVWHHTGAAGIPGPSLWQKGFLGVDFFFAISGFLITSLLLRERSAVGGISLKKFYARRALRIFPLYYATLLVYLVLVAATRRHSPDGILFFHYLPAYATYTYNWFAGNQVTFDLAWSLATEEQFYLLWPPLLVATLALGGRKRIWPPLVALAVLIAVSQGIDLVVDSSVMPWRIPASMSLSILLGAAAALVLSTRRGFAAVSAVAGHVWSAPVAAVLLIAVIAANLSLQIAEILMVVVVVAACIVEWTPLHPMLRWRPLAFVGVLSYGVYLLHCLCKNVASIAVREQRGVVLFVVTLAAAILVAYLSFRFFETPVLKLKRRYEIAGRDGDELSRLAALSLPEVPRARCDTGG
jgi:peptidoglycan/LPS O-acetylase OafA/YrhL